MSPPTLVDYFGILFSSFFRWWWAAITGVASILSYLALPEGGVTISKVGVALLILATMLLLFLVLSVAWQGWLLYSERFALIRVAAINKCKDYGGDHVVILTGPRLSTGALLELHRFVGGVEVPIAVIEVMQTNSKGEHQANPLWFAPGHLREFGTRKFDASDLRVRLAVSRTTVAKCFEEARASPSSDLSTE